MSPATIEVDYLVIGAGAGGMAFADVIAEDSGRTMAVVDRYDAPGGHWTMSYPFVRLHSPSHVYGVHSRAMPSDADATGRASRHEILDYYDRLMRERLLESGRVVYLPMHHVEEVLPGRPATARARCLVSGETTRIVAARRVVDAAYLDVTVPAMGRRPFEVADGVPVVPVNELVNLAAAPQRFTVIGAGKTGIDACLWLLNRGVDPARITWISPRDAWLLPRGQGGPEPEYRHLQRLRDCRSPGEAIGALERLEMIVRRDPAVTPGAFRCATVSTFELAQLRRIEHVVRLGRVRRVDAGGVRLEGGDIASPPGTVYVDCTADGLTRRPLRPVFADGAITLQPLLPCLLAPSAAVIGHLERLELDDDTRNRLAVPAANPSAAGDVIAFYATRMQRLHQWSGAPDLFDWLRSSRLAAALPGLDDMGEAGNRDAAGLVAAHLGQLARPDGGDGRPRPVARAARRRLVPER
nr:NAD(P)/FAD-dependent oxidoreductase [Dactylosporangium thailandense]